MVQSNEKSLKVGLGMALGVAVFALAASGATDARADDVKPLRMIPLPSFVSIECSNPGSAQDVAKTPVLKNTAQTTLYKGQRIRWSASDGDVGDVTLTADLPPGATVKAMGKPGQAYTCSSSYVAQPDLKIRQAKLLSTKEALVEVQNADPYAAAGNSQVLFELRSCQTDAVLATSKSAPVSLAKGEYKALTFGIAQPFSGKTYVRAVADVEKVISESNEANNLWDGQRGCVY